MASAGSFARRRGMINLAEAVSMFHDISPAMPSSLIMLFLAVGAQPGLTPSVYAGETGLLRGPTCRALLQLSVKSRSKSGSLHLLIRANDTHDYRMVRYYLSPTGQALWNRLEQIIT